MSTADNGLLELQALLDKLGQDGFILLKKCDSKAQSFDNQNQLRHILISNENYKYIAGIFDESDKLQLSEIISISPNELQKETKLSIDKNLVQFILLKKGDSYIVCSVSKKHDYELCGQSFKVTDQFYEYLKEDIGKCAEEKIFDKKYILETLRKLQSYARANQEIEFVHNGIAYTLKNGEVEQSGLSDEDVNTGSWTDGTIDSKIRYTIDEFGIIQVKAFGFRKNLQLAEGKTANLPELASHIKEQTNKFLLENHVIDFEQEAPVFKDDGETFADGQPIIIGGDESTFFKIVSEGVGITTTLLKTGEVEEQVYLVSSRDETTIFAPGVLTGGIEVIAQKVTDITSIGSLAYDLAVDEEVRTQTYSELKGVKDEIADDPASFIPVLGEVILTVTTGNTTGDMQTIFDENADSGKRSHLGTRGVGNAVITVMSGAALVKNLPEIGDKLTDWVKVIKKSRSNIRKVLDTDVGIDYLRKYFDKFVNGESFEDWLEKVKNFKLGRDLNFEVHHIFPVNLLENNQELQRILNKFGFDFNGVDNAIPLQKKSVKYDLNGHANHPQYDKFMGDEIYKILGDNRLDDLGKFENIQELINKTKNKLETDVLLGNKNVNDIISW